MVAKPRQLGLFESICPTFCLKAGSLRTKDAVREALERALIKAKERYGLDRGEVSKELSRLVGEHVSHFAIDNWCSGKEDRRFPLECAKALAMMVDDDEIIRAALQPEYDLLDEAGRTIYAYGEMVLEDKVRGKKRKTLEERAIEIRLKVKG